VVFKTEWYTQIYRSVSCNRAQQEAQLLQW